MLAGLAWTRQPTASPASTVTVAPSKVVRRSATVRPTMTAARDIGSERKRSMRPVDRSTAIPMAAPWAVPPMLTAKMPAIR